MATIGWVAKGVVLVAALGAAVHGVVRSRRRRGVLLVPSLTGIVIAIAAGSSVPRASLALPYEHVGSETGLRSEVVTALYQDRAGFMWVGSREGLTLFDGYVATGFEHDTSDPASLSDNTIRTVFQDRGGDLWVGTNTGGLDRLDLATRAFRHYRRDAGSATSLSHNSVYAIAEDSSGSLWVGTQHGLNRLDPATGLFERFLADPSRRGSLGGDYVGSLLVDREDRVWVGTIGGGLGRYDRQSGAFITYRHDAADAGSLGDDSVFALMEDSAGRIVVGTNVGVEILDPPSGRFRRVAVVPPQPGMVVTSFASGPDGTIWVGTYGSGIYQLDAGRASLRARGGTAGGRSGSGGDKIIALLTDRDGTLWIGTWGAGLSRLRPAALIFGTVPASAPGMPARSLPDAGNAERDGASSSASSDLAAGLAESDVTSLGADGDGGLWVGTGAGELLRWEPSRGSWSRFLESSNRSILGTLGARDGGLWVGTSKELLHIDPRTRRETVHQHRPDDPTSLGPGFVKAVLEDREGRLWVGTGEGGLQRIGEDGVVVERFLPRPNDPASLSDEYVTTLLEDRRGTLWVGTRSGGLNALDPRTGRLTRYQPDPGRPGSISHHYVTSLLEDGRGRLWVATGGGGLNLLEPTEAQGEARFVRFTTADGLFDNNVMAILADEDGALWLSTKRGLSKFDPRTRSFMNFTTADGLPSAEFESASAVRSGAALYFGSVKGIVTVPVAAHIARRDASPTVVTSVRSLAGDLRGPEPAWLLRRAEIPYGRWLSIELAVLDFNPEHRHTYAYRLGGAQTDWVDLGARRVITFTDLAPGRYAFTAKGRNDQGMWSEISPGIEITIVPPLWRTGWFRVSVALALVGLALIVHRARLASLESRNRRLTLLTDQRERAREELARAYERLRLLARRLEVAKEEERKHIARELHDELGPALTAVVINLQLLKDGSDADRSARRIADTVEIVDRMVQRIRDLSLDLRPPLLDEMGLVIALKGYLETQAERSGVAFEVRGVSAVEGLPGDVEIVAFRVVQEAVTNVLRHAHARGAIVTIERREDWLEITVQDDGEGFDVRATMETQATGRIMGILGMQERVRMLDGEFEIRSEPGKGTTVLARLPMGGVA